MNEIPEHRVILNERIAEIDLIISKLNELCEEKVIHLNEIRTKKKVKKTNGNVATHN